MPTYTYECDKSKGGCGHVFTMLMSIENRNIPTEYGCSSCLKYNTLIKVMDNGQPKESTKSMSSGLNVKNMDPLVRERLEKIKNRPDICRETSKIDW